MYFIFKDKKSKRSHTKYLITGVFCLKTFHAGLPDCKRPRLMHGRKIKERKLGTEAVPLLAYPGRNPRFGCYLSQKGAGAGIWQNLGWGTERGGGEMTGNEKRGRRVKGGMISNNWQVSSDTDTYSLSGPGSATRDNLSNDINSN
jgi:hypothetical protein